MDAALWLDAHSHEPVDLERTARGHTIDAVGRMYAGYKPEDPERNLINEKLGSKAFQIAFIQQVSAILDAVRMVWATRT